ncbi:MAG: hypothetical protein AAF658_21265 [Myxococcota bacterium]
MKDNDKKTYNKPKLRIIELRAEETLSAGCRDSSGGTGSTGGPCTQLVCFAPGS